MSKSSLTNSSSTTDSEEHTIKPVSEDIFHKKNLIVNEEWNENDDMFFDQKTTVVANFDEFLEDKMLIEKNNKVCSEQLITKEYKKFDARINVSCPTIVKQESYPLDIIVKERIAMFQEKMLGKCNKDIRSSFNKNVGQLTKCIEANEKNFRGIKLDPFSDAILLLVASHVGINKKDFLNCLKQNVKVAPGRIAEIKKFSCYKKIKNLFNEEIIMKNRV